MIKGTKYFLLEEGDTIAPDDEYYNPITFFCIHKNQIYNLNPLLHRVLGYARHKKHEGLIIHGCGMDMGFSVVYNFSRKIFPSGFPIKKGERNRNAINGMKPSNKNYMWDDDGGYALTQRWL